MAMKIRDSGMPAEAYWNTFFEPPCILKALGLHCAEGAVVDGGAGYGTLTLAVVRISRQNVFATDVGARLLDTLVPRFAITVTYYCTVTCWPGHVAS